MLSKCHSEREDNSRAVVHKFYLPFWDFGCAHAPQKKKKKKKKKKEKKKKKKTRNHTISNKLNEPSLFGKNVTLSGKYKLT